MTSGFADHFSSQAAGYASARPTYPRALFTWMDHLAPRGAPRLAWDCGTGSGQAARGVAPYFDMVVATDPSTAQLANAVRADRVAYVAATAERASLASRSVTLVTIAQAMHWFDLPRFHAEVARVAVPGALVVAWTYGLTAVDPATDAIVARFTNVDLADYWPPERRHVDDGYAQLAFPYPAVDVPPFEMSLEWTRAELVAYIRTWSSVAAYVARHGMDPVESLDSELRPVWPDGERRTVRWPLAVRAGIAG